MTRPKSITIISWLLIASGVLSTLGMLYAFTPVVRSTWSSMGMDPTFMAANAFAGGAVHIIAGYAMLQQRAWGRTLYVAYIPLSFTASWFMHGDAFSFTVLPGALFFLIILYFLYRPVAEDYFAGSYTPSVAFDRALASHRASERNDSSLKRVFGIVAMGGGGFLTYFCLLIVGFADDPIMQFFLLILFGTPAAIALLIGVFLWGKKRWTESVGWTLAVVGTMSVVNAITMWFMSQTDYWRQIASGVEGLGGGLLGALGVYLLFKQYDADRTAVET